jgi:hypothetical protein
MYGEDIPDADIYNFLGEFEEGTGTICEDEAQGLIFNKEKIRTYKNSYSKGSVKPRVVMLKHKKYQVYYKTFCPKWFAGESIPRDKGFMERLAVVHMIRGKPRGNIKKPSPKGKSELYRLRNKLLIWKIQRVGTRMTQIKTPYSGRDRELWEDFVNVFNGSKFLKKAVETVRSFVKQRQETITGSLEATVFRILVANLDGVSEIGSRTFWDILTYENPDLPGSFDPYNKRTFYPDGFTEKLTLNSLAVLLEDKFQGKKVPRIITSEGGRQCKITMYRFDKRVMKTLKSKYGIETS